MSFPSDHWKTPRASIATVYCNSDLGYATHGAHIVADILRAVDVRPSLARRWKALDFGCGTARVARILSRHLGYVVGFDPEPNCISVALEENLRCKPMAFVNLILSHQWENVVKLGPFDLVCAVSVFEHLADGEQQAAMERIQSVLKPPGVMSEPGRAVLWLHRTRNADLIARFPVCPIDESDTVGLYLLCGGSK